MKYAAELPKMLEKTKQRANNVYPLRGGCEKTKIVPVGRGKSHTERYRVTQLAACEPECPTRTILGFFAHITWQASGPHESEAVEAEELPALSSQNAHTIKTIAVSADITPVNSTNRLKIKHTACCEDYSSSLSAQVAT